MEKIKIAMLTEGLKLNGISCVIMNYCRKLDRNKYEITIFSSGSVIPEYARELKKLNIDIIKVPSKKSGTPLNYYKFLKKNLVKEKFDIVHFHCNSATVTLELFIAKLNKIKTRITHCHSIGSHYAIVHKLLKPFCNLLVTKKIACSQAAGKWLYGNSKYKVLKNAFDIYKFEYNENFRKQIRSEIKINDDVYVIGHVGRFNGTKNQEYLFKIFDVIAEKIPNSILMMVGLGPDFDRFEQMREKSRFKEKIILYGETNNPEKVYSAMDIFLFPSFYEGFGIAVIEAQLSGLKCIVSKNVPEDVKMTNELEFIPIGEENIVIWSNSILKHYKNCERINVDLKNENILNFDITNTVKELEKIYDER